MLPSLRRGEQDKQSVDDDDNELFVQVLESSQLIGCCRADVRLTVDQQPTSHDYMSHDGITNAYLYPPSNCFSCLSAAVATAAEVVP